MTSNEGPYYYLISIGYLTIYYNTLLPAIKPRFNPIIYPAIYSEYFNFHQHSLVGHSV